LAIGVGLKALGHVAQVGHDVAVLEFELERLVFQFRQIEQLVYEAQEVLAVPRNEVEIGN
jgi:hypothetical protein